MATATKSLVTVDITTGTGVLSFPHLFAETKSKNDRGEDVYDVQIIFPKKQRDDIRALLMAIKEVAEARWGANWKRVKTPLRDGDAEKDQLTEDGSTKGEKYPERLGCYFLNARSSRPVGVYNRRREPIIDSGEIYSGCLGKVAVTFYSFNSNGNQGVAAGLNGVQKVGEGESLGNARPALESMFDLLDDDEDSDLDEFGLDDDLTDDSEDDEVEVEVEKPKARKTRTTAKAKPEATKAKAKATKTKPKAKPAPVEDDLDDEDEDDDLYDGFDWPDDSDS